MSTETKKLSLDSANPPGPIQVKRINKAASKLKSESQFKITRSGVRGRPETYHESKTCLMGSKEIHNPRALELFAEVCESFDWIVSKSNASALYKALHSALIEAAAACPTVEEFTEPEEADRRAEVMAKQRDEYSEKAVAKDKATEAIMAKRPPGAAALIVAEYDEDDSDVMTDYFSHKTTKAVAIGWRTGTRESFSQLRRAAGQYPPTAELEHGPKDFEHRDNYSMGSGNYLKDGWTNATGWRVKSYPISDDGKLGYGPMPVMEDGLPVPTKTPDPSPDKDGEGYSIRAATNKKGSFSLVVPSARMERADFDTMRASAKGAGGWYSRKWGKQEGGFGFTDRADAEAWAKGQWGAPDPEETKPKTLFQEAEALGLVTGNHCSDLYMQDTPKARALCAKHDDTPEAFTDQTTGKASLAVFGSFDPYWENKRAEYKANQPVYPKPTTEPDECAEASEQIEQALGEGWRTTDEKGAFFYGPKGGAVWAKIRVCTKAYKLCYLVSIRTNSECPVVTVDFDDQGAALTKAREASARVDEITTPDPDKPWDGEHRATDCPCTDGKHVLTVRKDAGESYSGYAIHSCKVPISQPYLEKITALQGQQVTVSHIFRGPTGLPTEYSAGGLSLRPLFVVESEPTTPPDVDSPEARSAMLEAVRALPDEVRPKGIEPTTDPDDGPGECDSCKDGESDPEACGCTVEDEKGKPSADIYRSEIDGAWVVHVDTPEDGECDQVGPWPLRIYINDDQDNPVYDHVEPTTDPDDSPKPEDEPTTDPDAGRVVMCRICNVNPCNDKGDLLCDDCQEENDLGIVARGARGGYTTALVSDADDCTDPDDSPCEKCQSKEHGADECPHADEPEDPYQERREANARHLEDLAERMQADIDHKRAPLTQNATPRRLNIKEGQRSQADSAELTQRGLRALAGASRENRTPGSLAGLGSRTGVSDLLHGYKHRESPRREALMHLIENATTDADKAKVQERAAQEALEKEENDLRFLKIPGFFPTPPAVVARVVELLELDEPGLDILEPSAGIGHLAAPLKEYVEEQGGSLECSEINYALHSILEAKGFSDQSKGLRAYQEDFLRTDPMARFDRVAMNPPFEKGQDVEHVRAAIGRLRPGGILVAVMTPKGAIEIHLDHGGHVEALPDGSFTGKDAFRQTGVSSSLIVVHAPEAS